MRRENAAAVALVLSAACAGCGDWSGFGFRADGPEMPRLRQALAREVGAQGRVFSTEIDARRLQRLRETAVAGKFDNVTVVEATSSETGLPPSCCDAIVLRRVYHHVTAPSSLNASLLRSLRPGGVLAVIDFPPPFFLGRGGLGVPAQAVISEMSDSGFQLLRLLDDWPGRGPLESYCVLFRKPS